MHSARRKRDCEGFISLCTISLCTISVDGGKGLIGGKIWVKVDVKEEDGVAERRWGRALMEVVVRESMHMRWCRRKEWRKDEDKFCPFTLQRRCRKKYQCYLYTIASTSDFI